MKGKISLVSKLSRVNKESAAAASGGIANGMHQIAASMIRIRIRYRTQAVAVLAVGAVTRPVLSCCSIHAARVGGEPMATATAPAKARSATPASCP